MSTELEAMRARLRTLLAEIERMASDFNTRKAKLDQSADTINGLIERYNAQAEVLARKSSDLSRDLETYQQQANKFDNDAQTFSADVDTFNKRRDALYAKIDILEESKRILNEHIDRYNEIVDDPNVTAEQKAEYRRQIQVYQEQVDRGINETHAEHAQLTQLDAQLNQRRDDLSQRHTVLSAEKQRILDSASVLQQEKDAQEELGNNIDTQSRAYDTEEAALRHLADIINRKQAESITLRNAIRLAEAAESSPNDFIVDPGQLTFDAEGIEQEGHPLHSRSPHVPGDSSGITIGRGFDVGQWSAGDVYSYLTTAGMAAESAEVYKGAAGLKGQDARKYLTDNRQRLVGISSAVQKRLFEAVYAFQTEEVKRICNKEDVVREYGSTNWPVLKQKIKDVLVDLKFRGDYTPNSRTFLQKHVANNDLPKFTTEISNATRWPNVPSDRFQRRKNHLSNPSSNLNNLVNLHLFKTNKAESKNTIRNLEKKTSALRAKL